MLGFLAGVLRVLFGFAMACLAAAAVSVSFAITPEELMDPGAPYWDRVGLWTLYTATVMAVFLSPALLAIIYCEWQGISGFAYYVMIGIVISVIGLIRIVGREDLEMPSLINAYGMAVFLMTGLVGGAVYWICAGQFAHQSRAAGGMSNNAVAVSRSTSRLRPASTAHAQLPPPKV